MKRQLDQIHKVLLQVTCLQPRGALINVFLVGVWQLKLNTCAQVMTSQAALQCDVCNMELKQRKR